MVDKSKNEDFHHVRSFAKKTNAKLRFSSENLPLATNYYVAWIDLMGAGHLMKTSIHKTANFLARLHMAIAMSRKTIDFSGYTLAINDGVFLICDSKKEIMSVVREIMSTLSQYFISNPRPHDRFFVRCSLAYGPVHFGKDIVSGISDETLRDSSAIFDGVAFGPPIIAAYTSEKGAPPFGVAIDPSARSFAPQGIPPFRMTHWLWWQNQEEIELRSKISLPDLKDCLFHELKKQFSWMRDTLIFLPEIDREKICAWEDACKQYFSLS